MRKQFLIQKILTGLLLMIIIIILGILRRSSSGYSLNVLNGIDLPEANGWCTSLPEYLTQTGVPLTLCYDGVIPTEIVEVKLVLSILEAYPEAVFLDVGSNTGFFSLPAAQRGVKVVSVDAVYKNMVFLHKSAVLNGVENHITMVNNAISDVYLSYLAGLDDRYDYGEVKNQMATRYVKSFLPTKI
ncbi:uncharacterized protein LOC111710891 [Eurytemora carolleeae]|uniref:uncharacterized protein LOC111710891 n=1 Tax=Eurytemora carolleeae TaxID=1294199 RepID=UPI000C774809|nr:uncharacterized protein LOC111710891 [Eurytemora carolleeae]|eukprot:XP_023340846.1 uncharacterized protein LOC111710891 [Eurytemora affinis]